MRSPIYGAWIAPIQTWGDFLRHLNLFRKQEEINKSQCNRQVNEWNDTLRNLPSRITSSEIISFFVPRSDSEAKLYCCVFHHPLRSAIITPYSRPLDRLRIVSNKEIFKGETTFTDGTSQIAVRLIEAKGTEEQVPMDKKSAIIFRYATQMKVGILFFHTVQFILNNTWMNTNVLTMAAITRIFNSAEMKCTY